MLIRRLGEAHDLDGPAARCPVAIGHASILSQVSRFVGRISGRPGEIPVTDSARLRAHIGRQVYSRTRVSSLYCVTSLPAITCIRLKPR